MLGKNLKQIYLVLLVMIAATHPALSQEAPQDSYQVGSEWGKKLVTQELLDSQSKEFVRAAKATVKVGRATGFYLGKISGEHFVATNYHVIGSARLCDYTSMQIPLLDLRVKCKKHLGSWSDIDLSLQTVELLPRPDQDLVEIEKALTEVAKNFSFDRKLTRGMELITVGFGMNRNPSQKMVASADADCLVFSADGDYRYISDPDTINPGPYKTWSFANGCDASHGDSGSAFVERSTSEVVGIIWTGAFPKDAATQDSRVLAEWLREGKDDLIWKQLSYGVPAEKIAEFIYTKMNEDAQLPEPRIDPETQRLLKALLVDGRAREPQAPTQPAAAAPPLMPDAAPPR
jgi:hypothetical protein